MNPRSIRGGLTSNQEYVCLSCRLQSRLSQARRNVRYQHTSTPSTDLTPSSSNDITPQAPQLPYGQTKREIKPSKDLQDVTRQLPSREARELRDALQQKFLEKRRLEGLSLSVQTPAEDVSNVEMKAVKDAAADEADTPQIKKSKGKAVAERKAALKLKRKAKEKAKGKVKGKAKGKAKGKTKEEAKKSAAKANEAPTAESLETEISPRKRKVRKAKEEEEPEKEEKSGAALSTKVSKPRGPIGKASATRKSRIEEILKSNITELEKALESRNQDERKLIFERVISKISKMTKPSTMPDALMPPRPVHQAHSVKPRRVDSKASTPPLPARQVSSVKLRKIVYDAPENLPILKRGSKAESSRARRRGTLAPPGEAPELPKLSKPSRNQSLKAALLAGGQENAKPTVNAAIQKINAEDLKLQPLEVERLPVPTLAYGLERVLFNPGVYHLQDPRSKVFNFDPYLQKIMPVTEFDFDALKEYITSSKDQSLKQLAGEFGKRYVGSTSSMTGMLAHFHFLLSQWRTINTSMLSKKFPDRLLSFTELQRSPSAIFLRWQDGSYAIDADKQFDNANILMMLGKSMEKLLTLDTGEFERYRRSNPEKVTEEERNAPEAFHYTTMGDFLMRSQLDAFDPRLPGTGMFDLKTRAVVSIRMEPLNHEQGVGYQIKSAQGEWESFEREYYDMIRAAFLKYSLQVRMGRMDGIFVAYHNTNRIFGFQYISIEEMDFTLHGQRDTSIGDQEFKLSLKLLNKVLNKATEKYPEKSLRIHFEAREVQTPFMYIFAEPVTDEQIQEIQTQNAESVEAFQRRIQGLGGETSGSDPNASEEDRWADIQADVQEAMARDEMSVTGSSEEEESSDAAARVKSSELEHPGVFEDGPLYRNRSLHTADEGDLAAVTEGEEEELEAEEDKDSEVDDQKEALEHAEDPFELESDEQAQLKVGTVISEDVSEDEDAIEATSEHNIDERDSGTEEVFEDETELNTMGHDGDLRASPELIAELDDLDPGNGGNARNIQEEELESLGQEVTQEGGQPESSVALDSEEADSVQDNSGEPEGDSDILEQPASSDDGFDTRADQPFFEEIDQAYNPASGAEVLAMALTIRNKVNGKFVKRPEDIGPDDKWSVEYTLEEVAKPERAWSLYLACQERRRRKLEGFNDKQEDDSVTPYIEHLRKLSRKGAVWREEMDKKEQGMKVAVVGQPIPQEDVMQPEEQRREK